MIHLRALMTLMLLSMVLMNQGCAPEQSEGSAHEARKQIQLGIYLVPVGAIAAGVVGAVYLGRVIRGIEAIRVTSGFRGTLPSSAVGPIEGEDPPERLVRALTLSGILAAALGLDDYNGPYDLRRIEVDEGDEGDRKRYGKLVQAGYPSEKACLLDIWPKMLQGRCFASFSEGKIPVIDSLKAAIITLNHREFRETLNSVCICVPSFARND